MSSHPNFFIGYVGLVTGSALSALFYALHYTVALIVSMVVVVLGAGIVYLYW